MGNFKEYQREHNGITWKEYVDMRFAAAEDALNLARREMERRLEGMNELRGQLDRQAGTFITRDAADICHERIMDRVGALQKTAIGVLVAVLVGLAIYFLTGR